MQRDHRVRDAKKTSHESETAAAGSGGTTQGVFSRKGSDGTNVRIFRESSMGVEPKIVGNPPKLSILVHRVFHEIFTIHFGVPLFLETPIWLENLLQEKWKAYQKKDGQLLGDKPEG